MDDLRPAGNSLAQAGGGTIAATAAAIAAGFNSAVHLAIASSFIQNSTTRSETDLLPLMDILNRMHAEVVKAISKPELRRICTSQGFGNDYDDAGTNCDVAEWR